MFNLDRDFPMMKTRNIIRMTRVARRHAIRSIDCNDESLLTTVAIVRASVTRAR
jgi:hypothetical protein